MVSMHTHRHIERVCTLSFEAQRVFVEVEHMVWVG